MIHSSPLLFSSSSMAISSKKSAAKANLLGNRESLDDLETKSVVRKQNEACEEKIKVRFEFLETESDQANFIKEVAARKKTLFVSNLPHQTEILDIINFFYDVGQVVRVRLVVNHEGWHAHCGFVEFASTNQAKKALRKKKYKYLLDERIYIDLAKSSYRTPKYCIDHKVWLEDRERLVIGEDETVEGLVETPEFVEEVAARKKMFFVTNLAPQTTIRDIDDREENNMLFHMYGGNVSVRLIVNHWGKHVGCAFAEFTSSNKANKALERNGEYLCGRKVLFQEAETVTRFFYERLR